jgi:hypothetical protein
MPQECYLDVDHLDAAAAKRACDPQFMRGPAMTGTLSFQCLLQQGSSRIVAWIEARGAIKGARVELDDEDGLWLVAHVFAPPRTATWLQENGARVRKGLPSLRPGNSKK